MYRLIVILICTVTVVCRAACAELILNGSFEQLNDPGSVPVGWKTAGDASIVQKLSSESGRDGGRCAKLECTHFEGSSPSAHVMLCQVGVVSVARGKWYKLTFWAKGEGLKRGAIDVALSNTRVWDNAGLSDAFSVSPRWEKFEMLFQAKADLPAEASRLQFWFKGNGVLWLDDVTLTETEIGQQWFPQITTVGVKNFVPNSSFECGSANWGSYTYGLHGWAGNLYRLEGNVDSTAGQHGRHSMKISLTPETLPVFWFDYYDPIRQPVRRVLVGNRGWFCVKPEEKLTLSAFLRADADNIAVQMMVIEAPDRTQRKQVMVDREWKRYEFTFAPHKEYIFIAIGIDLEESRKDAGTLWLDAIQLERGDQVTAYEPRCPVESFAGTETVGNIFTSPKNGASITLRAFNNSDTVQTVSGKLTATDFFDNPVFANEPTISLAAHSAGTATIRNICAGRLGFFRASWTTKMDSQSLRYAIIEAIPKGTADSPLGFNHAYPWQFLTKLARDAGIVWWRDWSAKWQTIEPQKGKFNWLTADEQVDRVRELDCNVEVLLPFASAIWNSTARSDEVKKAAGNNSYLRSRLPVAFPPKNLDDFGRYAAEAVRHYRDTRFRPVTHFQLLNEPVYTDYALPRKFGFSVEDYVRLLKTSFTAMKAVDAQCRVVGGISANVDSGYTREFIEKGGLQFLDIFDLHMYDAPSTAESYDDSFRSLEELMRAHGGPKPVWITEWGCYADDDPPCIPQTVGDDTMNRCKWRSERVATEHIVKFTAVTFAHGVRKIFFHAGTCGTINGPDAGGVLFEYGGEPRKMYAGVAALTKMLGTPDECVKMVNREGLIACVFKDKEHAVAVTWRSDGKSRPLTLGKTVIAFDVMGNEVKLRSVNLGESPIYLVGRNAESIIQSLENN